MEEQRTRELPEPLPDEEIFRWHGELVIEGVAVNALNDVAFEEGMSFDEVTAELQRRRYRYSQVRWPLMIGEEPLERMPYRPFTSPHSLTTSIGLPTGATLSMQTHAGELTKVKLSRY